MSEREGGRKNGRKWARESDERSIEKQRDRVKRETQTRKKGGENEKNNTFYFVDGP